MARKRKSKKEDYSLDFLKEQQVSEDEDAGSRNEYGYVNDYRDNPDDDDDENVKHSEDDPEEGGKSGKEKTIGDVFNSMTDEQKNVVYAMIGQALEDAGIPMISAEVTMIPQNYVTLTDETAVKNLQRTLDLLEDDDDFQAVYHNWDE